MRASLHRVLFLILVSLSLGLTARHALAAEKIFLFPAGYIAAKDLPEDFRGRVRSIRFDRKDAFEGTVARSRLERWVYNLGNDIHVISRETTLRRRMLFAEGGEISKDLLAETERTLRAEEFLSDAMIAVGPVENGQCEILVMTYDQWTTVAAAGAKAEGLKGSDVFYGRWDRIWENDLYWFLGLFETNLAGTGTMVGGAIRHDPIRNGSELTFRNQNLTPLMLQVSAKAAWLSDGDSVEMRVNRPLLSRTDKYAYGLTYTSREISERLYFDANQLGDLPDSVAENQAGEPGLLRVYDRVATRELSASFLRSFGMDLKFNIGPAFTYRDRRNQGGLGEADTALLPFVPVPASALEPYERSDALLGVSLGLYRYGFRTSRNFRNLKWSESVETGWRLNTKASVNQAWLGADNSHFHLHQEALYSGFWSDLAYASAGAAWQSFLSPSGDPSFGQVDAWWEGSLRPHRKTASWATASWTHLYATPRSVQLPLGELNGLTGFPSFYFAGQARFLATAEQRYFPDFEWLTMVPAFAAFVNAGNTFPTYREFVPGDLHYSLGLGLRLGRSKSTQKSVQHINLTFPLADDFLTGPVFSILAKKTL
ncbi:MAG: hypothetical protein M3Y08_08245 [Fibrobacterota bacterium]|nr:hypothetical protein [Fibrobacterota bacterium]